MRAVFTMAVALSVTLACGSLGQAEQGKRAPDFTLRDLDGKKVKLSDLKGEGPILISLWALWCRPCLEEMPHIDDLYEKYADRGLQVFAVSQDSPRSLSRVKSYVKSKKYQFRVLQDPNGDLTRTFKTRVIPFTVILDSDLRIVHSRTGYRKGQEAELEKVLLELLSQSSDREES